MKSAFVGEIRAIMDIVETRGYVEALRDNLSQMKTQLADGKPLESVEYTTFRVSDRFFRVWDRNVDKIGILEAPLPEKIVLFYALVFSALEDIQEMSEASYLSSRSSRNEVMEHVEELLQIATRVLKEGREICSSES